MRATGVFVAFLSAGIPVASAQRSTGAQNSRGEVSGPSTSKDQEQTMAEALVRERVVNFAKAVRAKDIDGVMSLYAPTIVSFDVDPPLRYAGIDNKRRAWQAFFAAHSGPVVYEVHELDVTTDGPLAFAHSLNHVKGTLANGHVSDLWVRWTACFRRIDGAWLVVHDHASLPADLAHGRAVLNLTP